MQPKAYNYWEGNTFRIPGLPVRPTYAPALAPQVSDPLAGSAADTLAQLGFRPDTGGIGNTQGLNESTLGTSGAPGSPNAGMGPGAQVTDLADMAGRVATGIGMVSSPFGMASGFAGFAGPTPKTSYGLRDLMPGSGLFDLFSSPYSGPENVTGTGQGINDPRGDVGIGSLGGFGGSPEIAGRSADRETAIDSGYSGASNPADRNAADTLGETGMYAKGGKVTRDKLAGPNPPGPDDGLAFLDVGERVIPKRAVQKLEAQHGPGLFDLALNKGKLPTKKAKR